MDDNFTRIIIRITVSPSLLARDIQPNHSRVRLPFYPSHYSYIPTLIFPLSPYSHLRAHTPFYSSPTTTPSPAMKSPENNNFGTVSGETLNLLNSLLNSINNTQTFKSKWNIIKTKLNNLKTLISDLTSFPETSISCDLIKSLSVTLSDALPISVTCHTANLTSKLKTQNDVDSIISKLDNHIRDFNIVIESGVLNDDVLKVSKRENVRVTARNLITRLQIGSVNNNDDCRRVVLDLLINLINEDDKNVVIVVAQGVVPVIVRLLDSGSSPEIREKSVFVIARVSLIDSCKHVLMAEGLLLLHYLIRLLESGISVLLSFTSLFCSTYSS